ncbi:MAG: SCP-like extracellular [Bacteroidetes bacterium OLB9]|nr:MAG: SCP-like extracellular [Bacteroidetes bacterium OLB9]
MLLYIQKSLLLRYNRYKLKLMKVSLIALVFLIMCGGQQSGENGPSISEQQEMVAAVNKIRTNGCYCGRRYMKPVSKVKWSNKLYQSALNQANDMNKHHFFAHFSNEGLDIGDRLDVVGYNWKVAGENLGEGQLTFEEVLGDWLKSYSHCTMLMNPKVTEMAIAHVDKYWVQHFGTPMETEEQNH